MPMPHASAVADITPVCDGAAQNTDHLRHRQLVGAGETQVGEVDDPRRARVGHQRRIPGRTGAGHLRRADPVPGQAEAADESGGHRRLARVHRGTEYGDGARARGLSRNHRPGQAGEIDDVAVLVGDEAQGFQPGGGLHAGVGGHDPPGYAASGDQVAGPEVAGHLRLELIGGVARAIGNHDRVADEQSIPLALYLSEEFAQILGDQKRNSAGERPEGWAPYGPLTSVVAGRAWPCVEDGYGTAEMRIPSHVGSWRQAEGNMTGHGGTEERAPDVPSVSGQSAVVTRVSTRRVDVPARSRKAFGGRRRIAVPARLRIMGWLVLLLFIALATVPIVTRNLVVAQARGEATQALYQEAQEFRQFAESGVNQTTGQPYRNGEELLRRHISRQYLESGETMLGVTADGTVIGRPRGGQDALTRSRTGLRQIVESPVLTGTVDTRDGPLR
ncbi:hypothetical protein [Streptomyces coeruleorubidus]|uniref:hypothetical protein n=1 Tax=Streptomyces coeruleorubidus TaxID=116188 RepID=UPI0033C4C4F1